MRDIKNVAAILLADIHLQELPPMLRCTEPDWYEAMARPLAEVKALAAKYECPVLCAGDVFDHWRATPKLINFAIEHLPHMYAIPGQHDLPYHNLKEINRSAYRTLMHADIIHNVDAAQHILSLSNLAVYGYPFGTKIQGRDSSASPDYIRVAMMHEYTWKKGYGYPTAPKNSRITKARQHVNQQKYNGYDVVVIGDNHRGFQTSVGNTTLFNCGSLMQRHRNELKYEPQVGLLTVNGDIIPHKLNTKHDKYLDVSADKVVEGVTMDMAKFFESLQQLDEVGLDFSLTVKHYLKTHDVAKSVKNILIKALIDSEI